MQKDEKVLWLGDDDGQTYEGTVQDIGAFKLLVKLNDGRTIIRTLQEFIYAERRPPACKVKLSSDPAGHQG